MNTYRLMRELVLLGALLSLCGCVSMPTNAQKDTWPCDTQADAAVEQERWQQAFELHERFLNTNPRNCLAMYHLGYIWGQLGDSSQEVVWYQKAVACGYTKDDVLFFNLGMAYADLHQTDQAIVAFKKASKLNPGNAENYFGLALTAQGMGDSLQAEQALEQAIAISPNHWDARILLAKIYLDLGRMEDARPHLERVLNHAPENEEAIALWRLYKDRLSGAFEH